jgi:hypothetical protein
VRTLISAASMASYYLYDCTILRILLVVPVLYYSML